MSAPPPDSEINFDFLQDEAEWLASLEACRERWSKINAPLLEMEADFVDLQRQLLQEAQPSAEAWDRLLEDFDQSPAQKKGLRIYLEAPNVAQELFTSPAGSLDLRDAAAIRHKFDTSISKFLGESITSTELRDALMGVAAKVASRPDFYRPAKVPRDTQRSRLGMDEKTPHFFTKTEALPGTEQPKGAEPRLVGKLRVLAEWHLRYQCNAWPVLRERQVFWTAAEQELRDFLHALFPEPVVMVPNFDPAPAWPVIEKDTRSRWAKFKDQLWNATIGLLFPRLRRRRPVPKPMPRPAPQMVLAQPKGSPRQIKMLKVPANRELWPLLIEWHRKCERDAEQLDQSSMAQNERLRFLEDHMASIMTEKQSLERGIDVAGLRADSITRDLGKLVEVRCTQVEGLVESISKLS